MSIAPHTHLSTGQLKDGRTVIFRTLAEDDTQELRDFINTLSKEQTFIRFSGEDITLEQETEFVQDTLKGMASGDKFLVVAIVDNQIVGSSTLERNSTNFRRSKHVAEFGITLAKEYRGLGLGRQLMQVVLDQATQILPNISMITLTVYEPNTRARTLYESFGFKKVGQIPNYILHRGELVDELIMVKQLT